MLFDIEFWSKEQYLPTKRHRLLRQRYVKHNMDVEVNELEQKDFPVAFMVHDLGWIREDEEKGAEFKNIDTEIRTYKGKLWKAIRYDEYVCRAVGWLPISYIKKRIKGSEPYWKGGEDFTENSIIKNDDTEECKANIRRKAEKYIIFDRKVWRSCGEPMYVVTTYGLGHNHGGTGFLIDNCYNPNISSKNYFNALEREQAITYGKQVALNRGDTDSVKKIGEFSNIEVLMPEMVRRNPEREHGDGDPFINSLESMIEKTESSTEAAFLAMIMSLK